MRWRNIGCRMGGEEVGVKQGKGCFPEMFKIDFRFELITWRAEADLSGTSVKAERETSKEVTAADQPWIKLVRSI